MALSHTLHRSSAAQGTAWPLKPSTDSDAPDKIRGGVTSMTPRKRPAATMSHDSNVQRTDFLGRCSHLATKLGCPASGPAAAPRAPGGLGLGAHPLRLKRMPLRGRRGRSPALGAQPQHTLARAAWAQLAPVAMSVHGVRRRATAAQRSRIRCAVKEPGESATCLDLEPS